MIPAIISSFKRGSSMLRGLLLRVSPAFILVFLVTLLTVGYLNIRNNTAFAEDGGSGDTVYLDDEGDGGDAGDGASDSQGIYLDEEEEDDTDSEVAEEEAAVEIPPGYVEHPEFATTPDNPNRDMVAEEDWPIAIGKYPFSGLSNRDVIWVFAQLHILFASFILGVPIFIIISEIMAWKTGDERYERLAKETTKVVVMCYSFTAIFGTFMLLAMVAFYPTFTTWLFRGFNNLIAFWYPALILIETSLMYMYYYMWDPLQRRGLKGIHIILGLLLNVAGISLLILMDAPAAFMLTPTKVEGTLRGIASFGEWAWLWNFTWWPLNIHRLIGNLTFGGYIVGLIGAYMYL
ncbi:MAG: cytochrome ubiquinol oxidase subunit I, partial [Nitrospinota bacterium]